MKNIKDLIKELKLENKARNVSMNSDTCTEYGHTILITEYNNTLDIIKRLKLIKQ